MPREVETLAKMCTAKKQLNVAQNKNDATPLGVVVVVLVVVVVVTGASQSLSTCSLWTILKGLAYCCRRAVSCVLITWLLKCNLPSPFICFQLL